MCTEIVRRLIGVALLAPACAVAGNAFGAAPELLFERDVRPILKQHCFHCHGDEPEKQGGLDLRTTVLMQRGGDSGAALAAGDPASSPIWRKVAADEMPAGPKKLPADQKQVLFDWIAQGARTARSEPENPDDQPYTEEELSHWSFRPPQRPVAPRVSSPGARRSEQPIDAFLLETLQSAGIEDFSEAAPRASLIRRATFDLLGRPPTPEEAAAFLADAAPGGWERLVDRLLASPEYGQRWARHWLDAAGYSDTYGGPKDETRPHAWRYRDYVVDSLNADKPYDAFVIEQLAGDELAPRPFDLNDPRTIELLTATGFLQMAPDVTQDSNTLMDRNQAVADVLKVAGSALLGLTVGCAQCHHHKYDPVTTEDYYRWRAVFDPALNIDQWKSPNDRLVDVTPAEVAAHISEIDARAEALAAEVLQEKTDAAKVVFERELGRLPEDVRPAARAAIETPEANRTPEQAALLLQYPNVKTIEFIRGFFVEYDKQLHAKFTARDAEVAALRESKPPRRYVMAVHEPAGAPSDSRVMHRGDPEQRTAAVAPGELAALRRHAEWSPPPMDPAAPTSGRRLAYARWLTSGTHPLTARVVVNRVWMHHFGRGIVGTPGDFGLNGERPSHPELLDWLATEFVREGWRLKPLHRLLMTSRVYQQSSRRTPLLDAVDPENRLLGRMSLRRLDAESVRDALLAVSGRVDDVLGGPGTPIVEDGEGRAVFGSRMTREGLFSGVADAGAAKFRRSLYVESRRALPLLVLDAFDLPAMTPNCDVRRSSTAATQSLFFLNDETVCQTADVLAERLWPMAEGATPRIEAAFALLFGAPPTAEDLADCQAFLAEQAAVFREQGDDAWKQRVAADPQAADVRALSALCHALLCSNRFLYVD